MTNELSVKENKKTIGSLFDRIAEHYDFLNHLLTLNIDKGWRKKTVKKLKCYNHNALSIDEKNVKLKILDVAAGTGDLTLQMIKSYKNKKIICQNIAFTGIDLSGQMLKKAKQKIDKFLIDTGLNTKTTVALKQENVEHLSFEDNTFDVVTCAFGVRNFSNLNLGLSEMNRVLKPKGQVVILEFTYPKNIFIRFGYNIYFTYILPFVGKIISKDNSAYKYLMKSVKEFPKETAFIKYLQDIGFENCQCENLTFGIASIYTAYKK